MVWFFLRKKNIAIKLISVKLLTRLLELIKVYMQSVQFAFMRKHFAV